jgi:hypothetical protein
MKGKDKIPILLAQKAQDLVKIVVPKITEMLIKIGLEKIEPITLPDICLPADKLKPLIELRNKIVDKLNLTSKTIETLSKSIIPLTVTITATSKILQTLNTTRTIAESAIPLLPTPPPGSPDPANTALIALSKVQTLERKLSPKVVQAQNTVDSINIALTQVTTILAKILAIISIIDIYLNRCKPIDSPNMISLNSYLTTVVDNANKVEVSPTFGENYKGFVLDIVEEQFSPTVKRSKAVAKNNSNIVLLQTPLSFTSTPQVLIEELKLIIDKDNLKAD